MTKSTARLMLAAMLTGVIVGLTACRFTGPSATLAASETEDPGTHKHNYPLDNQIVTNGTPASLVIPGDFPSAADQHRWFFNGAVIDAESAPALGVTNFDTQQLQIISASITNCGFYRYENKSGRISETAQLLLAEPQPLAETNSMTPPTTIVVYGTPIGGGGTGTGCPGPYHGYVEYVNSQSSSGGWLFLKGGQAIDDGGLGACVVYYGVPFTNHGCGPNVPPSKYPYHFCIFFQGSVPAKPYPLKLVITN
jgi:hypothetical protein